MTIGKCQVEELHVNSENAIFYQSLSQFSFEKIMARTDLHLVWFSSPQPKAHSLAYRIGRHRAPAVIRPPFSTIFLL